MTTTFSDPASSTTDAWVLDKRAIDDGTVAGTVFLLGPGAEKAFDPKSLDQLCSVSRGSLTVTVDETNTILLEDEVMRVAPGRNVLVRNHTGTPAKILMIDLPPARVEYVPVERPLRETTLVA